MRISDYKPIEALMCLFKGKTKTGKKTAWATFPEPIYAFDTDFRMATIANHPVLSKRDIEFDQYTDYNDVYFKLEDFQNSPNLRYKTIVIHSLTSLARIAQNYLFDNRGLAQGAAKRKKGEEGLSKIGIINLMDLSDYNGESSALGAVSTKLRIIHQRFNVNIVLVAHTVFGEDKIITGGNKIGAEIPSYFNEVYHFEVDTGMTGSEATRYICNIAPTSANFAGTSFYNMPARIDFTNQMFYELLLEHMEKKQNQESIL